MLKKTIFAIAVAAIAMTAETRPLDDEETMEEVPLEASTMGVKGGFFYWDKTFDGEAGCLNVCVSAPNCYSCKPAGDDSGKWIGYYSKYKFWNV